MTDIAKKQQDYTMLDFPIEPYGSTRLIDPYIIEGLILESMETGLRPNFGWVEDGIGSGFYITGVTHGEIDFKEYNQTAPIVPLPNSMSIFLVLFVIVFLLFNRRRKSNPPKMT